MTPIVVIGLVGLLCWLARLRHQHVEQRRLEERRRVLVANAPEIAHVIVHVPPYDWQRQGCG